MYFRWMAAIFDVRHTQTSDYSHYLLVLPVPETWVQPLVFRCYHVYELSFKCFPLCFRWMVAIFDVRHTQTSVYIRTSLAFFPDSEKMGIAVGTLMLSCIRSDIYVTFYLLSVNGHHFEFTLRFLTSDIAVISGKSAQSAVLKTYDPSLYRSPLVIYTTCYNDAFSFRN